MKNYQFFMTLTMFTVLFIALAMTIFNTPKCETSTWRNDLLYGTEVAITNGFFKDHTGVVKAQVWKYNAHTCNERAFTVSIYSKNIGAWDDITIEQIYLEKK